MWKRRPIFTIFAALSFVGAFAAFAAEMDLRTRSAGRSIPLVGDVVFETRDDGFWLIHRDELHDSSARFGSILSETTEWRRYGVELRIDSFADGYVGWRCGVSFGWLFLLLILPALCVPAIDARERRRVLRVQREGRCVRCGYDLKGSTGDCPECGATRGA